LSIRFGVEKLPGMACKRVFVAPDLILGVAKIASLLDNSFGPRFGLRGVRLRIPSLGSPPSQPLKRLDGVSGCALHMASAGYGMSHPSATAAIRPRPTPIGDYAPSLRSPWRAA